MIAATQDFRLGLYIGWLFGAAFVAGLWCAAAQYRRDHENRSDRARIEALARINRRGRP